MGRMEPSTSLDLEFAITQARIGFAAIGEDLVVRERRGALADWLPEPGRPCAESGLLFAMESALQDLRVDDAPPLILPSIGLANVGRVNVSVAWNPATRRFVVVAAPDEGTEQLDRLLFQQRRERQLLQQQAAAAADRLRVSSTLYRDIVESTDDAVLRLAPDLTLTFVSGPAAALIDAGAEAAIGQSACAVLPLPLSDNPWRMDMCAGGPASFEQPVRRGDGATRWLWWNVRWLGDEGDLREFQAVGRDVTEVRRIRAELARANEEAKFAALARERLRIAHDLHDTFINSLVTTLARLSLLRRAAPEGALKAELSEAEADARSGLRAAREAVGAIRSEFEVPEALAPLIEAAADALRPKMRVTLDLDPDLTGLTPTQATAIARVAREALRNVERHSGARAVAVSLRRAENEIVLRIEDDGIGFAPDPGPSGHYGIVGMREQAKFAGGALTIGAARGGGARLTLVMPSL